VSNSLVPLLIIDQVMPSKCRIAPNCPTAKTLLPLLPHTPVRLAPVPLLIADQLPPS